MRLKKEETFLSVFVILASLGVYLHLFVFADRDIVFLYGHMGLAPFDEMTSGRYWMAGFVISGFLSVLYLVLRICINLMKRTGEMVWKTIVAITSVPLVLGILWITMVLGDPFMTFLIAMSSAFALIVGISLGFSVVDDLMGNYKATMVYLLSGLGLVPLLLCFKVLELPGKGLLAKNVAVWGTLFLIVVGFVWLVLAFRLFKNRPSVVQVIKGTLATGYIGLPLVHYLAFTPKGIPYITAFGNFFADSLLLRLINWAVLVFVVFLAKSLMGKQKQPDIDDRRPFFLNKFSK